MRRRDCIKTLAGSAVAWPLAARAQQPVPRVRRIGTLVSQAENDPEVRSRLAAFKQGLDELGWTAGRNVAFEFRYADGRSDRMTTLAAELLGTNVDVVVAQGSVAVAAARKATSAVPIVMVSVGDAVGSGFIASLARPGGNVTGLVLVAPERGPKRLGFIKEIMPGLRRVALLWNAKNSSHRLQLKEVEAAARTSGLQLASLPAQGSGDIEKALPAAVQAGAEALITMDDALIQAHRRQIVEMAARSRIPVVSEFRPLAVAGALLSYGPSLTDSWRRAAGYVDKILKGAEPANLPVEQPTKFVLVINLKTVKALGLAIPPTLLLFANEVIE